MPLPDRGQRQQFVTELASNDGAPLYDVLGRRSEPIQPRDQGSVECRWNRRRRPRRGGQRRGTLGAGLQHRLGQLLDKQRHAVGAVDDLRGDFLRQSLAAGDA